MEREEKYLSVLLFSKALLDMILRQYGGRAQRLWRIADQAARHIPRGKMAVALTTCCPFDSAARISFSRVIPMFIDDGSPVRRAL